MADRLSAPPARTGDSAGARAGVGRSRKAQADRAAAAEVDAMNLWKSNIDHSLADLAQVGGFAAEGEAFLKPGGLMVAWEIQHDDFESLSAEEVDAICERFEQALGQVGDMDLHLCLTGLAHQVALP